MTPLAKLEEHVQNGTPVSYFAVKETTLQAILYNQSQYLVVPGIATTFLHLVDFRDTYNLVTMHNREFRR